ncbi:flagellin [Gammaproteobacteria bacterium LSUCC0112]|nr:flagellin [Gammaproteobacteria bacterium LSUCC0112]
MAQVINTNIASLNAQRNLSSSQAETNQALQRLSSGLRINSAKDDAAGLAISTRFDSQIKGIAVAIRNSGDGVSLAQTAEGALGSMTESLQRVRELALQAANGTNSASDREALQAEASQLLEELGRTADTTNFNGVKLLDGSFSTSIQVGANAGDVVNISIGKLTADTLGVAAKNGVSSVRTDDALATGELIINGVSVGATRAADDNASTAEASTSAISKAAAINRVSDQTGVTAVVDANSVAGSVMTAGDATGSVSINGTSISIQTTADAATTRASVVTAINAQSALTGVTAVDTGDDDLGVTLVAADGRNIEVAFTTLTAANTGLAAADTYAGGFTLVANSDVSSIEISGTAPAAAGLTAGTYTSGVANVSTNTRQAADAAADATISLDAGDLVINGVAIAAASAADDTASYTLSSDTDFSSLKEGSAIAIAAAINKSSDATGVTASANANVIEGEQTTTGTDGDATTLSLNGVDIALTSIGDQDADRASAVAAINAVSGQTGVVAEDNGAGLTLTAADGRNIVMGMTAAGAGVADATDFGIANTSATATPQTTYSSVTLSSGGQFTVSGGTNGNAALEQLGFTAGTFGGAESGQFLSDVDISTQEGANAALAAVDNALNSINSARADLGAIQNRFESTISNLAVTSENLSTANSRIKDADFASEAAALSRSQVLQQAGISILSQANSGPEQVLSLLR